MISAQILDHAVNIETEKKLTADEVRKTLSKAHGVVVIDNPKFSEYPLAVDAAGKDETTPFRSPSIFKQDYPSGYLLIEFPDLTYGNFPCIFVLILLFLQQSGQVTT